MSSTICFTSDFGLDDAWVGVCHAVMQRVCPGVLIIDLSHQISPFDVRKGAAVAAAGVYQVPDAVHLAVVDPGVGGGRRDLVVACRDGTYLVGPDNGILIPASRRCGGIREAWDIAAQITTETPLPTFHARDVLAPAAALLACGADPSAFGYRVDESELLPAPFGTPIIEGEVLLTEIVDIDRFGSARTSVTTQDLARLGDTPEMLEIGFGHVTLEIPFVRTYSDVDESDPLALWDSSGWLSLAVRLGSAAERYGLQPGVTVRLRALR